MISWTTKKDVNFFSQTLNKFQVTESGFLLMMSYFIFSIFLRTFFVCYVLCIQHIYKYILQSLSDDDSFLRLKGFQWLSYVSFLTAAIWMLTKEAAVKKQIGFWILFLFINVCIFLNVMILEGIKEFKRGMKEILVGYKWLSGGSFKLYVQCFSFHRAKPSLFLVSI